MTTHLAASYSMDKLPAREEWSPALLAQRWGRPLSKASTPGQSIVETEAGQTVTKVHGQHLGVLGTLPWDSIKVWCPPVITVCKLSPSCSSHGDCPWVWKLLPNLSLGLTSGALPGEGTRLQGARVGKSPGRSHAADTGASSLETDLWSHSPWSHSPWHHLC